MSPAALLAIVSKAQALIADATRWAERHFAEDANGTWAPVGSERATRFNLAGALIRSAGPSAREAMSALEQLLATAPRGPGAITLRYASGLTHEQALELLGWSIRQLESAAMRAAGGWRDATS